MVEQKQQPNLKPCSNIRTRRKKKHFILRPKFVCFVVSLVEGILCWNKIVDANKFPIGMCIEFNRMDCN